MVPFAGLLAALERIPDPRRRQGRRYGLAHLLLFCVLAVLAGATSYRRIRLFIGVHRERLNATFGARFRRAPAVNTLRALLHALDPAELEAAFRRHAEQLGDATTAPGRRVVALDGKTLRRQLRPPGRPGRRPGAQRVRRRGGAHPGPPGDRRGRRGRGGAGADRAAGPEGRPVHRRRPALPKKPSPAAAATGNALLVRVKDNQPRLRDALVAPVRRAGPGRPARDGRTAAGTAARSTGASRSSRSRTSSRPEWRPWIACAARVSRLSWCKDTRAGLWRPRREVAYYVSQVRLDAADFGRAVRAHWGIENRDHHVRDRTLREDDSRIRRRPGIFARLRSFALNILRAGRGQQRERGRLHQRPQPRPTPGPRPCQIKELNSPGRRRRRLSSRCPCSAPGSTPAGAAADRRCRHGRAKVPRPTAGGRRAPPAARSCRASPRLPVLFEFRNHRAPNPVKGRLSNQELGGTTLSGSHRYPRFARLPSDHTTKRIMKLCTLRAYAAVALAGCAVLPRAADALEERPGRARPEHPLPRSSRVLELRRVHAGPGAGQAALNRVRQLPRPDRVDWSGVPALVGQRLDVGPQDDPGAGLLTAAPVPRQLPSRSPRP